ncbi:MAG TPA: TetR/AcrR family transcriptional regulator [Hyphomicrobiaceae bacterium]|nr:TetR/AcrR family transcriptional regulator [Hyphomicrobiaceae bacterium]
MTSRPTSCPDAGPATNQGPVAARTRGAIVKTAADLFVRRGYAGASMDLIAAEAGVARQTIYNQFESKESLFRAIFSALADEAMTPLAVAARKGGAVRATLLHLARSHMADMLSPTKLALHRLVVAEVEQFPELGRAIYDAGATRVVAHLADFLHQQSRLGHLDVPNPKIAAAQFLGMLVGLQQFRALMKVEVPEREIDVTVTEAVDTFLRAFAPQQRASERGAKAAPGPAPSTTE